MADYTYTGAYDLSGNGTNLIPEIWFPKYLDQLPVHTLWAQFVTSNVEGDQFLRKGVGDTVHVNFFGNLDISSDDYLGDGTLIPVGTQTSSQTDLTVREDGRAIQISGFAEWLTNESSQIKAASSVTKNALAKTNAVVGGLFVGASSYFSIYGTLSSQVYENEHTGTRGTQYVLPGHVDAIVNRMGQLGIDPMEDGFYHWVAPPGGFTVLKSQSSWENNMARLGVQTAFTRGLMGEYKGVMFHKEFGADALTTYSATVGTSVIFGADAVIGDSTVMQGDPNMLIYYPDYKNDAGRVGKLLWYGKYAYSRTLEGTTNARVFKVYHKMGGE